jgi:hypothetical protein
MTDGDDTLKGIVEVDETYIGGKRRRDQASKRDNDDDQPKGRGGSRKIMAVVGVERDGKAKARKGRMHSERTIASAVYEWLDKDAVLVTDELPAYKWIGRRGGTPKRGSQQDRKRVDWWRSGGSNPVGDPG